MSRPANSPPAEATLDEVVALCRRLRLKYVREQVAEVLLTARAQRWDPTELLRNLLLAEAEGRDRSTIESKRRKAHFPAGKTFESWIESRSSIPATAQRSLRSLESVSYTHLSWTSAGAPSRGTASTL